MYKRQNKILFGSLAGLIFLLVGAYMMGKKGRTNSVHKDIYEVPDIDEVDEIRLQSKESNVVLKYNGVRWRVNDKYDADKQLITVLFATLKEARPRRVVADMHRDSIRKQVHAGGIQVHLLRGQNKVKEFYTGGNKEKTKAYFMDAGNGPHLMAIPGYRVYVAGIFELDELGWLNRRIFDFNWRNFKKLTVVSSNDVRQNFEVESERNKPVIEGLAKIDTAKLYDYLNAISILEADRFIHVEAMRPYDSLAQTAPLIEIEVTDVGNSRYRLVLYPPLPNDKNILGKKGETAMALFSKKKITPLLRRKDYFILEQ